MVLKETFKSCPVLYKKKKQEFAPKRAIFIKVEAEDFELHV
jgi:hypothetical protein